MIQNILAIFMLILVLGGFNFFWLLKKTSTQITTQIVFNGDELIR